MINKITNKMLENNWIATEFNGSIIYDKYLDYGVNPSIEIDTTEDNKVSYELYFKTDGESITKEELNELNKAMKEINETIEMIRKELK